MALLNQLAGAQERIRGGIRQNRLADTRMGQVRRRNLLEDQQNRLAQTVGNRLAQNDLAGARTAALEGGDIQTGMGIGEVQRGQQQATEEQKQAALQQFGTAAGQLLSLPKDQQEGAYFKMLPQLQEIARRHNIPFEDDGVFNDDDRAMMRAMAAQTGNLPEQDEGGFTLSQGQTRFGPGGKQIASVAPKPDDPKRKAVNVRLPNGTITPGRKTEDGRLEYKDQAGIYRPAPHGASMAGVQLSGTEADADKVRARKFRQYEDATSSMMLYGRGIINAIDTGTPLFGAAGWMAGGANSARAQVEGVIRGFGGYTKENGEKVSAEEEAAEFNQRLREGSETWDRLRKVVGDRTDVLGMGISLAYQRAKLLDPTGRISDKDLEASMKSLGFHTNDPKIIRRRIIQEMSFLNRAYQDRANRNDFKPQSFKIPGRKKAAERENIRDQWGLE